MAIDKIGLGIIGLSPGKGWAASTILPALRALPEYEIAAVSTSRKESAEASAKEFNIPRAYSNHEGLVSDPAVDVVVVSVRVPHHLELTEAALKAGKHVYCEWPLGNGLKEAEKLAKLAKKKGVKAAVGLQARSAPSINYIRDLVAEGYVGKVLSTSVMCAGLNGGGMIDSGNAYLYDVRNGANMLTISFGHSVDAMLYAVGKEVRQLSAITANQRKTVLLYDTGETIPMTSEDQVAVTGIMDGDGIFSAHFYGGMPRDPTGAGFVWDIHGSEGDLRMTAMCGLIQMFDVTISGTKADNTPFAPLPVPAKYAVIPGAEGFSQNIAQAFRCFSNDLRDGTRTLPTFDDAVVRHQMIDAIQASAKSGKRQKVG